VQEEKIRYGDIPAIWTLKLKEFIVLFTDWETASLIVA
jgi:hypothetical protein